MNVDFERFEQQMLYLT